MHTMRGTFMSEWKIRVWALCGMGVGLGLFLWACPRAMWGAYGMIAVVVILFPIVLDWFAD